MCFTGVNLASFTIGKEIQNYHQGAAEHVLFWSSVKRF